MPNYDFKFPAADRRTTSQAKQLAEWSKEEVPIAVQSIEDFLQRHYVWYLLNRNEPAFNCEQAAKVRRCLGQTGIPLGRELKSFLGYFTDEAGSNQKVAVHCRANHQRDDEKIKSALQISGEITKLERTVEEGKDSDDAGEYGLVNPFTLEIASLAGDVTMQVFDNKLFEDFEWPATVMTNAGSRTWSVEFQMLEIEKLIPTRRFFRADIVQTTAPFHRPVIGILTGNSPESGSLLLESITKRVRELRDKLPGNLTGDVYLPKILLRSVPAMGMTMDLHLRKDQTWKEISVEIERMCAELASSDAKQNNILAIACNTTPYYSSEIIEIATRFNVRFISIVDAVGDFLQENSINNVALLGIGYVNRADFSGYSRFFRRDDFKIHPLSEAALSEIEKLAYDVKREKPIFECSQKLSHLLKRHDLSKKNVVFALTELSLIAARAKWNKESNIADSDGNKRHVVDGVEVYAEFLADLFMGNRDIATLKEAR